MAAWKRQPLPPSPSRKKTNAQVRRGATAAAANVLKDAVSAAAVMAGVVAVAAVRVAQMAVQRVAQKVAPTAGPMDEPKDALKPAAKVVAASVVNAVLTAGPRAGVRTVLPVKAGWTRRPVTRAVPSPRPAVTRSPHSRVAKAANPVSRVLMANVKAVARSVHAANAVSAVTVASASRVMPPNRIWPWPTRPPWPRPWVVTAQSPVRIDPPRTVDVKVVKAAKAEGKDVATAADAAMSVVASVPRVMRPSLTNAPPLRTQRLWPSQPLPSHWAEKATQPPQPRAARPVSPGTSSASPANVAAETAMAATAVNVASRANVKPVRCRFIQRQIRRQPRKYVGSQLLNW